MHELVHDAEATVVWHNDKCLLEGSHVFGFGVCVAFFEQAGDGENNHLWLWKLKFNGNSRKIVEETYSEDSQVDSERLWVVTCWRKFR